MFLHLAQLNIGDNYLYFMNILWEFNVTVYTVLKTVFFKLYCEHKSPGVQLLSQKVWGAA